MGTADTGRYLLSGGADALAIRHRALGALFDPPTFRHLAERGVDTGWRCWEVGAGGTGVVDWLADRVGAEGRVVATDLDLSAVAGAAAANVEVRRHDVGTEPAPGADFDLVHARLVLVHVAERDTALATMAGALRPGGWLVIEDADPGLQPLSVLDPTTEADTLANRIRAGFRRLLAERGADLAYGRTLVRRCRAVGLHDVRAEAAFALAHPAGNDLELATVALIGPQLVAAGLATEDDLSQHRANVETGIVDLTQPPMITAWGRKPARA